MKTRKTMVLVPFHGHIEPSTESCLDGLGQFGYPILRRAGVSAIDSARNEMVAEAMSLGYESILFVDSDILFHPRYVLDLEEHDLPIVCGGYVKKDRSGFAHIFDMSDEVAFGESGKLVPIIRCGMGFTLIKTAVFDMIKDKLNLPKCRLPGEKFTYPWFMPMTVEEKGVNYYRAEDYAFCDRARKAGFNIKCDTRLLLGHIGPYVYSVPDLEHMIIARSKNGVKEAFFKNK